MLKGEIPLRRWLSISLILLIGYQCMGYLWLHHWRLGVWRHAQWEHLEEKLKAGLDLEGVETIAVADLETLDWEADGREFKLAGQMYDVLAMHPTADGRWTIRCIADAEETRMKTDFETLVRGNDQDGSQLPTGLWTRLLTAHYLDLHAVLLPAQTVFSDVYAASDWQMEKAPAFPPLGQPPRSC